MTTWICDWSHWQGDILPADVVAEEGFAMVKLKAGGALKEGWSYVDPTFLSSAERLLAEPRLTPSAFWFLTPGKPYAQAGLFLDLLHEAGRPEDWAPYLDVEHKDVRWEEVLEFCDAWHHTTAGRKLNCYTNKGYWERNMHAPFAAPQASELMPTLELARWVPESVRKDPRTPFASKQFRAVDPTWWHAGFGGWNMAPILQFTDNALVAGRRTSASAFGGSRSQLRALVL